MPFFAKNIDRHMNIFKSIRSSENFHIVLWLLKDLCWMMTWKVAGIVMITPTILVAAWLAWRSRKEAGELLHSLAIVLWICANSVWMIGEFFFNDTTRHFALPFFAAGLLCVGWYYLIVLPRKLRDNEAVTQA